MEQDNVKYEKYIVAFVDVLGFSEMVKSHTGNLPSRLSNYFDVLKNETQEWRRLDGKQEINVVSGSDSIFFGVKANGDKAKDLLLLANLCVGIAKLQYRWALKNVWCRGAISIGDACFNIQESNERQSHAVTFGPSLVRCAALEKKANFPRVLLDFEVGRYFGLISAGDLIAQVNSVGKDANWGNWKGDILFDWGSPRTSRLKKDYPLFVDYLSHMFYDDQMNQESNSTEIVSNLIRSASESPENYEKYRWVGDYLAENLRKLAAGNMVGFGDFAKLLTQL